MGLILCIETATEVCSVCLSKDGIVVMTKEINEPNKHASLLSPLIDEVLNGDKEYIIQIDDNIVYQITTTDNQKNNK